MEKVSDKTIEQIQKLLKLAESPNKNEAESAMAMAQKLMLKHNIDMRQVGNHDNEYINEKTDQFKREPIASKYIISLMQDFFFVKIVTSRNRMSGKRYFNVIGEKGNVHTAIFVRNFLHETFNRLWKEYAKDTGAKVGSRDSFHYGLYKGLLDKLTQQRYDAEQEYGIVLVDDPKAEDKKNELFDNLSKGRQRTANTSDLGAMSNGIAQGKNINISGGALK